eukprot:TRINITY_DN17381_c0_g1_i1.p1 TRINITY_DN17381_c0_g1~~TRINITY_DN17381_c0_g1_i1.p1  ORF type:complete len:127 (-),score=39.35 TRINITY_DN17381_c0_g1_i1:139-519(-)
MQKQTPEGLSFASSTLFQFISSLSSSTSVPLSKFFLLGFSQGAILSFDLLFSYFNTKSTFPLAVVALSSSFVSEDNWRTAVENIRREWKENNEEERKKVKIVQSHGKNDNVLPFVMGSNLKDVWKG